MSKSDEYRANAAECQKMARLSTDIAERSIWLEMASDWLRMISKPAPSASDKFDTAEQAQGTNQEKSEGEH